MTEKPETAIGLLTLAVTKAAIHIANTKGLYQKPISDAFVDKLTKTIKSTLKDNLERVMAEWKEATEANLSNAWLKKLMKTQSVELAQMVIKSL